MRSWRDWSLVARAVVLLTVFQLARVVPYAAWRRFASLGPSRVSSGGRTSTISSRDILRAINTASRIVPGGGNCLVRALAARTLLAWQGMASELVFGVARGPAGTLRAHAWLRHQGQVVLGGEGISGFVPMPEPDRRAPDHAPSPSGDRRPV